MAVGFGLTTILASIQLSLSLLGSSGSSVHLSGQPSMEKRQVYFLFLNNNPFIDKGL